MKINFEIKIRKYLTYPIILISIFISAYIYATPYIAIIAFKTALENKDTEAARKYIDFNSVRISIKDQLSEIIRKGLEKEIKSPSLMPLRMLIIQPMVNSLVNSTVNATVTPNGLKLLLTTGQLSNRSKEDNAGLNANKTSKGLEEEVKISLYYKSINHFVIKSEIPNIDEPMKAYWKRNLIIRWRLSSIDLPFELMNKLKY